MTWRKEHYHLECPQLSANCEWLYMAKLQLDLNNYSDTEELYKGGLDCRILGV